MGEDPPASLAALTRAVARTPEDPDLWQRLALAAARVDFRDLRLGPPEVASLYHQQSQAPENRALARLLLAACGLRPREEAAPAHADTGLPELVFRDVDGAGMRLVVPPDSSPAYYVDDACVRAGDFRRFLEATGEDLPPEWEEVAWPDELPAVAIEHPWAREYAAWAGGVLPTHAQWIQSQAPEVPAPEPVRPEGQAPSLFNLGCESPAKDHTGGLDDLRRDLATASAWEQVHEWTSDRFEYPRVESGAEYWEALEARSGPGAVIVGRCATCARARARAPDLRRRLAETLEIRRWTLGFRLTVPLDGREDPGGPLDEAEAEKRKERARRHREHRQRLAAIEARVSAAQQEQQRDQPRSEGVAARLRQLLGRLLGG